MLIAFFFYTFALLAVGGAIATVTRHNAVHSAIALIVSLMGVAGLFLLQHAEFLFAAQIIVYIGGIMVLFLFVIMLVNLDQAAHERQFNNHWALGLACVLLVGAMLVYFYVKGASGLAIAAPAAVPLGAPASPPGNTEQLGDLLFSEYLLPFEVASVLLLVAVVGSVVMAKKRI